MDTVCAKSNTPRLGDIKSILQELQTVCDATETEKTKGKEPMEPECVKSDVNLCLIPRMK